VVAITGRTIGGLAEPVEDGSPEGPALVPVDGKKSEGDA
jgi:hypothetical protein